MDNNLLDALKEKYGSEYNFEQVRENANKFPSVVIESINNTHHELKCRIIDHKEYTSELYKQYKNSLEEQDNMVKFLAELEIFMEENKYKM